MVKGPGAPPYARPHVLTLSAADLADALGPARAQYCLLLNSATGDTTQDDWLFHASEAPALVTIQVNAVDSSPSLGPLDPKLALYPPGQPPEPLAEFVSVAECAGPGGRCIAHGGVNCSAAGSLPGVCPVLNVTLTETGTWTVSVSTDAPRDSPQSSGCYELSVYGPGVSEPVLAGDDTVVTFLRAHH
jgi:hypothetical protein